MSVVARSADCLISFLLVSNHLALALCALLHITLRLEDRYAIYCRLLVSDGMLARSVV